MREFCQLHRRAPVQPIAQLANRWEREAQLDQLLGTSVAAGLTLGDLMVADGLRDRVSPELFHAFHALMGEQADSYDQVRQILIERLEDGPASVLGMINKIKGQVGEHWFLDQAQALGMEARLAELGNQEAWDVAIDHVEGPTQYVQVKMYQDSAGIVEQIQEVQAKLHVPGRITDGDQAVEAIDFAIPATMIEPVQARLQELGLEANLIPMQGSAGEAAEVVQAGFDRVGPEALEHLFGQLLGAGVSAAALHGLVHSFLIYKGAKSASSFLGDTASQTGLTVSGLAAGMGIETVLSKLAWVGGVPTYVLVLSTSITTRAMLQRVLSRQGYVDWLDQRNGVLEQQLDDNLFRFGSYRSPS